MISVLLHGFWGGPGDWKPVIERLPLSDMVIAPDLYLNKNISPNSAESLTDWTQRFWSWLDHEVGRQPVRLVGYSMGGRLALSLWQQRPSMVVQTVVISARAGWPKADHDKRREWEELWAERFLHLPLTELREKWEAQEVFVSSQPVDRRWSPEIQAGLASSLSCWSPRHQKFSREEIRSWPRSLTWVFGALDQKYKTVSQELRELPVQGQIVEVANAGHRVLHDAPGAIAELMIQRSQ